MSTNKQNQIVFSAGLCLLLAPFLTTRVVAQTPTTIYNFGGGEALPQSQLVEGLDGEFYGTSAEGGTNGRGVAYKLTSGGVENTIGSFPPASDAEHTAALILASNGNFYGTLPTGGTWDKGQVIEVSSTGVVSRLWAFTGGAGGSDPMGSLYQASDGNLYGTTYSGGANNDGTIFKISTIGTFSIFYNFQGGANGSGPMAGLTLGSDGYLYGSTFAGGNYSVYGTLFKISSSGSFVPLYAFQDGTDGMSPDSNLVLGADDQLYGTAQSGSTQEYGTGFGTVFKMTNQGTVTPLYDFINRVDGNTPNALALGNDGNLYGTANLGGDWYQFPSGQGFAGNGTLFEVTPGGGFSLLYTFEGYPGGNPGAALIQGSDGSLYGTTENNASNDEGEGTAFKLNTGLPGTTSFSPTSGAIGTVVTVTGHGFTGITATTVGGTSAAFTFVSDTSVKVTVPSGTSTGVITLVMPSAHATTLLPFVIPTAPVVSGFYPPAAPVASIFTVTGHGFTGTTAVKLDGVSVPFTVASDTGVDVIIPQHAISGTVSVTNPSGSGISSTSFTVTGAPVVTSISPEAGPVGTVVTVTGSGFTGTTATSIGGQPTPFTFVNDNTVELTVPLEGKTGSVHIRTVGIIGASPTNFTVTGPPVISSFTPTSGPVGTVVTVAGTGFTGTTAASVDGQPAVFTFVSDTEVKVAVPTSAATGAIHVRTVGITAASTSNFVVN
jgi:uncharacterized repeat protein (TIGR03803 family)